MRVPESEYHDYVKRRRPDAQIEREALQGFVSERLDLHKGRCGYRRINRELRRDGIAVGEKRVPAVMRKLGLQTENALIDRSQHPMQSGARRYPKKLIVPSKSF